MSWTCNTDRALCSALLLVDMAALKGIHGENLALNPNLNLTAHAPSAAPPAARAVTATQKQHLLAWRVATAAGGLHGHAGGSIAAYRTYLNFFKKKSMTTALSSTSDARCDRAGGGI